MYLFDKHSQQGLKLFPEGKEKEIRDFIDEFVSKIQAPVINALHTDDQTERQSKIEPLYQYLRQLDDQLKNKTWFYGNEATAAEIRLFSIVLRCECAYLPLLGTAPLHKETPNLWALIQRVWAIPGVKETFNVDENNEGFTKKYKLPSVPKTELKLE
eukprot:TRINITY_DN10638_c0_g1_i1.p1 TRINITY_DN10638_c0_g1~~TRINITY_DN10638_c0_g1_i1.p1  ORF type:complete len:157 (-),score=49.66 TRINITY_DN10638_c0_g1_i1:29-499(-)